MGMPVTVPPERHPWLERLVAAPDKAVDSLLRGVAHLPGLQRASPCEALVALVGDLSSEAPEWRLLDQALCAWLKQRRQGDDRLLARPGGAPRFIGETEEGIRAAWRLELPDSSAWLHDNLPDLLRWAEGFALDATFDLAQSVLVAGARVQKGREFFFLWRRACEAAAASGRHHRLDAALLGLVRMPAGRPADDPCREAVVGLALWASHLLADERYGNEVVREWRALKARFPHTPNFWRGQWEAIVADDRYGGHPFIGWLKDTDPALTAPPARTVPRREPLLPKDIPGIIKGLKGEVARQGMTEPLWVRMKNLLDPIERYAEITGQSYYLVTSCTSLGNIILPHAPGHALALTRRALLWAPSNGHAWSVRARALEHLGQPDLALAVLWEGMRRVPSNSAFHNDLAMALAGRGRTAEAEALLGKAIAVDDRDEPTHVELARLLWSTGRAEAAFDLLRGFLRRGTTQTAIYTLGCLLVAEGQFTEAASTLEGYRSLFGDDGRTATLARLIAAGRAGQEEERQHLRAERQREPMAAPVPWDARAAEPALAAERGEGGRLVRLGQVSEADLLFQVGEDGRDAALRLVETALAADDSDAYAQLVKVLAVPEYRSALEGRSGRFHGFLPLQLALLPPDAPAERWHALAARFPDGRPLIDLVRLAHGADDDEVRDRLETWTGSPSGWDETWAVFLKNKVRANLAGDGASTLGLDALAHDALTQAVDVGWDATPLTPLAA